MLGACYLTEYSEGLNKLYDLDSEIWAYRTTDELVYKTKELLKNKSLRSTLRQNGQLKALGQHSVVKSLHKIKAVLFK